MPDTRHLLVGENPPSPSAQTLADTVASWTDARSRPLPAGPAPLAPTTAENASSTTAYNPSVHGALWQRFVNTFALELDTIHRALDDAFYDGFLEFPGKVRTSLDRTWKVQLPSAGTVVTSAAANDAPIYLSTGVNPDGSSILDPARSTSVNLLPVTRLFDFYYGLAQEVTLIAAGLASYPLPSRVATNLDGSLQVEWVTVNGVVNTTWSIGADKRSITFTPQLISGSTIVVHYTTFDIYYVAADALPVLFLRSPYFELFLTTSGTPPASNGTAPVAANVSIVTPQLDMMWNELDEIGLYLGKSRQLGEVNASFARRLLDSVLYPQNATPLGLRNALATELGLVSHLSWGPGGAATASTVSLGSQVYADSILVDRLPLPYYSIKTTANQTGTINLTVPALAIGQSQQFKLQLLGTAGPVVPGGVPLNIGSTLPAAQWAIYDQLGDTDPTARGAFHRPQSLFSAPTRPWYRGSLRVWKNGVALTAGTDFVEQSTTNFTLAMPVRPGDILHLGYVYDASETLPAIIGQAELDTDLTPLVRVSAGYSVDPVLAGSTRFTGWAGLPPNTDPATIPTNGTWTLTLEVTNSGSSPSSSFTLSVTLPPTITFDGTFIHSSDVTKLHQVSYIDGATVWVRNLTDASIQALLYDGAGRATPLLKAFATEIAGTSPLEWGKVRWDRTIWHTFNEKYDEFGFIPHLLDPDYHSQLTPRQIRYAGVLTEGQGQFGTSYIDFTKPGTALGVSSAVRYPDFVSGIGDGDDCKLAIATPDQITSSNSRVPLQNILHGTDVTPVFAIPTEELGAWWATIKPGVYFLNQEPHVFFAQPLYAEMSGTSLLLPGAKSSTVITAALYDSQAGLVPLRRVNFLDTSGNTTLYANATLLGTGASSYELAYRDFWGAIAGTASDGLTYTVSANSTDNTVTVTPALPAGVTLNVRYVLSRSFTVVDTPTGATIYADQSQPGGILVTYEGGGDVNVTDLPLHPYYNPRSSGFVYLCSDFYLPTQLAVRADPYAVPADGKTTFGVRVTVSDAYGSGTDGLPVSILVAYREGALSFSGVTDVFGTVTINVPASASAQLVAITATMQLSDSKGQPVSALLDQTFVELFSPYA